MSQLELGKMCFPHTKAHRWVWTCIKFHQNIHPSFSSGYVYIWFFRICFTSTLGYVHSLFRMSLQPSGLKFTRLTFNTHVVWWLKPFQWWYPQDSIRRIWAPINTHLGGGFKYFYVHPYPWGNDPIWRAYFSIGLVQPPTSHYIRCIYYGVDY